VQITQSIVIVMLSAASASADGGVIRVSQRAGPWTVTVFTSPTPPRAGPVDVSVLVQDVAAVARTDVRVSVRATMGTQSLSNQATTAAATNKLFQAALIEFPHAGRWSMVVTVDSETVAFEMEVGEPQPAWWALAPWIAWPLLAITVYGIHSMLSARRLSSSHRKSKQVD